MLYGFITSNGIEELFEPAQIYQEIVYYFNEPIITINFSIYQIVEEKWVDSPTVYLNLENELIGYIGRDESFEIIEPFIEYYFNEMREFLGE